MLGDNATRQHAGLGKGIDIADGEQLAIVARPEERIAVTLIEESEV